MIHGEAGMKFFALSLCVALLLFVTYTAAYPTYTIEGQSSSQSGSSETDGLLLAPLEEPPNCEVTKLYLDDVAFRARKVEGASLIIIARLGRGETMSSLNRARLEFTRGYLEQRFEAAKIVIAESSRVQDSGKVELYVGGKLLYALPFRKNSRSTCLP